jgi:hypothetical protein
MPFATGTPKPTGSGRKKGTPNRSSLEVAERLRELDCDPIEGMARIAMDEKHTPELRARMYSELATYLFPKRRAVELAADPVTPQQSKLVVEFVRAKPQVAPSDTPVRDV